MDLNTLTGVILVILDLEIPVGKSLKTLIHGALRTATFKRTDVLIDQPLESHRIADRTTRYGTEVLLQCHKVSRGIMCDLQNLRVEKQRAKNLIDNTRLELNRRSVIDSRKGIELAGFLVLLLVRTLK